MLTSDMAQNVATAHKMKSRQETTSLGQIVTVTAKPTISDKTFINTNTRSFKIQTGDMGPPPPCRASVPIELSVGFLGVGEYIVDSLLYCGVGILFCVFTIFGIAVKPPRTATSLQCIHSLSFQPLYNGHFFLSPRWPL